MRSASGRWVLGVVGRPAPLLALGVEEVRDDRDGVLPVGGVDRDRTRVRPRAQQRGDGRVGGHSTHDDLPCRAVDRTDPGRVGEPRRRRRVPDAPSVTDR